ncbi:hypothetical protein CHLNCDRAFT_143782 [Chlorella variabilis]|uniref:alanine--glyoxylate transaminase n=1 Tax=Chlorella variabilis TaxID=554065 RepID=E1ZAF4_CHLVA|nr:hypothetical protein CHLNCDRAFT_143782 [Chlorella variabilis]EFN57250.1 hypothetical protein CHLNCDRAFT_143782 [Chlorella variabilis]|eukprot:XP_005849352.1 hypothetical protein CHLNCDRAFT_143782 [Chlorella variabilis]
MLRQQQAALLRAAHLGPAACQGSGLAAGYWRSQSSQAAPADSPVGPVLPPFDYVPPKYTGPSKEEVLALRKQYLSPVMIVDGKMQYLFDDKGRRYLDAFAGIVTVSVGHCHPEVNRAVIEQTQRLQHTTTIYLHNQVAEYGKELTDRMPGNLKVAYFVNSGSEANDMAMMMARLATGNHDLVCLRNAYHGLSEATMGLLGQHTWKFPVPQGLGVHHALNPNPYRGAWGNDGPKYAADVADLIQAATPGIGNGLPLAAVVTTPEIAAVMAARLHFNTYGGNPVSSAAGRAVLRVIDEEGLQENCAQVGGYLLDELRRLQGKHDIIGDVRGRGLMVGVEMEPAVAEVAQVFERCKDLGVLLGKGGLHGNAFRIKPPMCWTKADVDFLIAAFDQALNEL